MEGKNKQNVAEPVLDEVYIYLYNGSAGILIISTSSLLNLVAPFPCYIDMSASD